MYIEHVYSTHLNPKENKEEDSILLEEPSEDQDQIYRSSNPSPTNIAAHKCPLCNKHYNHYYNVLRHMKTKHPEYNRNAENVEDQDQEDSNLKEQSDNEDDGQFTIVENPETHIIDDMQEFWYQCRFCERSFNARKKLTIHMNVHEENESLQDESGGYPCKKCNIVYKSKKSLWVHKNKKHPKHPEPSHCDLCEKTFFDGSELLIHMEKAHPGNIPMSFEKEIDENESSLFSGHWLLDSSVDNSLNIMKVPSDVAPKKRKRPAASENPDGEFACDMCTKRFLHANALQVHRGWHFRGSDGRKIKDPSQMWQPGQTPPSKVRKTNVGDVRASKSTEENLNCKNCDENFNSNEELEEHINDIHENDQKNNDNDKESEESSNNEENQEMSSENENEMESDDESTEEQFLVEKPNNFRCEMCSANFDSQSELRAHVVSEHVF